ncbi:hypothetical protein RvY_12067, partial [Ramazzottius varieornatus]
LPRFPNFTERQSCLSGNDKRLSPYKGNWATEQHNISMPVKSCDVPYCTVYFYNVKTLADNFARTNIVPTVDEVGMDRLCSDLVQMALPVLGMFDYRVSYDDYNQGCTKEPGDKYVCRCDWELCNGDLTLESILHGYSNNLDPFDMTPAMHKNGKPMSLQTLLLKTKLLLKPIHDNTSFLCYCPTIYSSFC